MTCGSAARKDLLPHFPAGLAFPETLAIIGAR